jgi:hypothetical protein
VAVTFFEFWPDYGAGPLWDEGGKPADLAYLPIDRDLADRLADWNARYSEEKVPLEGPGDEAWVNEGRRLLVEVRQALTGEHEVIVSEPWWVSRSN